MAGTLKKKYILGTGATYASNLISIAIGLVSVPLSLKYFGVERYAAIVIITTVTTYFSMTNFGIPAAAGVLAAKALEKWEQLRVIAKAFFMLAVLAAASLAVFLLAARSPSWLSILGKIPENIFREVGEAAFWSAVLFLANVPFAVFLQGFVAEKKVHVARFYDIASMVLSLLALLLTIWAKGNLVFYLVLRGLGALFASFIGALHFLCFEPGNRELYRHPLRQWIEPSPNPEFSARAILETGFRLFVVGLAALVVWHTDNLVISYFIGLEAVTRYSITFRLVTITFALFTTLNVALNPMYGSAFALGDHKWIESVYNRVTMIGQVLGGLVWIGSVAFARDIINLWVGPSGYAGMLVVFALGAYGYSLSLVHAHSGLLTSTNRIQNIVRISWSEALANLFLSLLLVRYMGIGGVALGTFLAAIATAFWMLPLEIYRRTEGAVRFDYAQCLRHLMGLILPALGCALLLHYFVAGLTARVALSTCVVALYLAFSLRESPQEIKALLCGVYSRFAAGGKMIPSEPSALFAEPGAPAREAVSPATEHD